MPGGWKLEKYKPYYVRSYQYFFSTGEMRQALFSRYGEVEVNSCHTVVFTCTKQTRVIPKF